MPTRQLPRSLGALSDRLPPQRARTHSSHHPRRRQNLRLLQRRLRSLRLLVRRVPIFAQNALHEDRQLRAHVLADRLVQKRIAHQMRRSSGPLEIPTEPKEYWVPGKEL